MQRLRLVAGVLGSIMASALLAGCADLAMRSPADTARADGQFKQLAEDYIAGYLAWRPQTGTGLGLHEYDGKVTDLSAASITCELQRLQRYDGLLGALKTEQLSPAAYYDYRILRGAVRRELLSFEEMQTYTKNPMTYAGVLDVNIYIKRNFAPLEDRVRSIISILDEAPKIMAAAHANLGETLPRPMIETAIENADGAADFLGTDLVEALKTLGNTPLKAQFDAANRRAIDELHHYSTWLKEEKLPKANNDFAIGRATYCKMLEDEEMVTLTPEQLLEIGMRELRRAQQVFAETAHQIDPSKKPIEVFEAIQKDHPTAENLIADTAKDLETIRQFLISHHIISLPSDVRAHVTETPQFMRAGSFASMDTPGPFETKATEAYYYVTPVEPQWTAKQKEEWLGAFNYYTTDIVSIHEVYPGHYIQFLHLNASPATTLEKIFGSYAFIEGWAHYGEQMLVDEGYGSAGSGTPTAEEKIRAAKYRLAQTDEALLRICRFCVSIRMHCQGMTVDEATKFFNDNCYYGEKPSRAEAMRGTFDPGYLFYTLGKLELLKLREDYRKQEGANFSMQKFHDEVVQHGMPPVRLLREVMLKDRNSWGEVF